MNSSKILGPVVFLSLLASQLNQSQAQVLAESDSTQNTPYAIATAGDLILGQLATNTGTSFGAIDTSTDKDTTQAQFNAELTNGSAVTTDQQNADTADRSGFAGIFNGTVLTYALPTRSNITAIDTYTSWGDSGRSAQNYTVSYSIDGGKNYLALNTVASTAGTYSNSGPVAVRVALTGLVAAATDIRFTFSNVENGGVGYTEIGIYGAPIPEPQAWLLVGFGLLGLGWLGRRRFGNV